MTKQEKNKLDIYFWSTICICGLEKKEKRWSCKSCTEKLKDTEEAAYLNKKCDEHMQAVKYYINQIGDFGSDD